MATESKSYELDATVVAECLLYMSDKDHEHHPITDIVFACTKLYDAMPDEICAAIRQYIDAIDPPIVDVKLPITHK